MQLRDLSYKVNLTNNIRRNNRRSSSCWVLFGNNRIARLKENTRIYYFDFRESEKTSQHIDINVQYFIQGSQERYFYLCESSPSTPHFEKRSKFLPVLPVMARRRHGIAGPGLINFVAFRLSPWRNSVRRKSIPDTHPKGPLILVALSRFYLDRISHIGVCLASTRTSRRVHTYTRKDTRNAPRRTHVSAPPPTHRFPHPLTGSSGVTDGFVDKELSRLVFVDVA